MTIPNSSAVTTTGAHVAPILPEQVAALRRSWQLVAPMADEAAELFYARLFELDPSLRPMFTTDLKEQGRKLMRMIGMAVNGLDRLDELVPVVRQLGARHAGYGVRDEHYGTVATALVWTLEQGLGPDFTPEVKDAWVAVYGVLATTMKDAAAVVPS